jgi:hypothetical protein
VGPGFRRDAKISFAGNVWAMGKQLNSSLHFPVRL